MKCSMSLSDGINRVTNHLHTVDFKDIPEETISRSCKVLADTFGCILAGNKEKAARAAHDQTIDWGGREEATMWGFGDRAPMHQAALVNALCARANDYGPVETNAGGRFKPMHISETLVPVTLAVGEKLHSTGQEIMTALICAEDFVGRLSGCMELPLPLDCRGTLNSLGSAVIYGKLRRFTPQQFSDALWLTLHQLNGVKQGVHFQLSQGLSALNGIMAADLAWRGLKGVDDPETELKHFDDVFVRDFSAGIFLERLGEIFYTTTTFKPWPACRATHAGIQCALEVAGKSQLRPEKIREVILKVSPWTLAHPVGRPFRIRGYSHGDAIYSLQYMVAAALLYGEIKLESLTEEAVADPKILALIPKIHLTAEGWPVNPDDTFLATNLKLKTDDGEWEAYVSLPTGNAIFGNGMSEKELKEKFMANANFSGVLKPERADAVWSFFQNFHIQPDLAGLKAFFA